MFKILQAVLVSVGILGISTGVLLLVIPRNKLVEKTHVRRLLFEYSISALFDRYHTIEKQAYRFHRPIGASFTIVAVITLTLLLGLYDQPSAVIVLNYSLGFWGTHVLILASWLFSIFSLFIGVILFMRPSALKAFEMVANRWIDFSPPTSTSGNFAERGFNRLVLRIPRLIGLLLLISGCGCLVAIAQFR